MTCAFAVRGALKKLQGVESVDVSLNKGLAAMKLKSGNTVTAAEVWETIRKNGFTPKETTVTARGEVISSGSKLQLKLTGSNQSYDLAASPNAPAALNETKKFAGKTVTLEGTLIPVKDSGATVPMQVRSVKP